MKSTPLWRITLVHCLCKTVIWVGSRFNNQPIEFHSSQGIFFLGFAQCSFFSLDVALFTPPRKKLGDVA